MEQIKLFDENKRLKITKEIALIELFGGYGSQALALQYENIPFKHHKLCEWAVKSIQAYKDIHFPDDNTDYSKDLNVDQIKKYLFEKGISSNYATHNLVNIQQVKGEDLEINDKEHFTYLLTYSFPCQDLSLAGKGKGMSDTSTRSGMLWEVERILKECKDKPDVLLMENVPQIHSKKNISDFQKWQLSLEEMGYKNYWKDLIATDYGIPQTRKRTFMVSVLGDYTYEFPKPIPLELKLKDLLEDNVDESFFLSDKQINDIQQWKSYEKPLENMEKTDKNNVSPTLTTRSGAYAAGMILVKNATKKGYLEANEGDGIDISSRMQYHRGTVQKDKTQTLSTKGGDNNGVVVDTMKRDLCNKLVEEGLVEEGQMATTTFPNGYGHGPRTHNESISLNTIDKPSVKKDLRIRKLTPRECLRIMGMREPEIDRVMINQSNASLYHLAGDSIVIPVLQFLFREMK